MKIVTVYALTRENLTDGSEVFLGVWGTEKEARDQIEVRRGTTHNVIATAVEVPDNSIEDSPEPTHRTTRT